MSLINKYQEEVRQLNKQAAEIDKRLRQLFVLINQEKEKQIGQLELEIPK